MFKKLRTVIYRTNDIEKAKQFDMVTGFIIKPLAKEKFVAIMHKL